MNRTDDRVIGKSVEQRVKSATGGSRDVDGAPEGGAVRREGESWHDFLQAKQGTIDPERGEMYFQADESDPRPQSDRSYRQGWKPASDVGRGTPVNLYPTK